MAFIKVKVCAIFLDSLNFSCSCGNKSKNRNRISEKMEYVRIGDGNQLLCYKSNYCIAN